MKRCSMCRDKLPASMFNKRTGSKDGLGGYCKPCQRKYDQKRSGKAKGISDQYEDIVDPLQYWRYVK